MVQLSGGPTVFELNNCSDRTQLRVLVLAKAKRDVE